MKRRTLYLPIETKARELLGKTLLAAKAVERGWVVFLGQDRAIREQMSLGVPGLRSLSAFAKTRHHVSLRSRHKGM